MIIIDMKKEKSIESALKSYKSKVQRTKQIQQLRERQEFVKPSVKRRKAKFLLSRLFRIFFFKESMLKPKIIEPRYLLSLFATPIVMGIIFFLLILPTIGEATKI